MPDFITLSCPSCGHKLQITYDLNKYVCPACGNEHLANWNREIIFPKLFSENKPTNHTGIDKATTEKAILGLIQEIEGINIKIKVVKRKNAEAIGIGSIVAFIFGIVLVFFSKQTIIIGIIICALVILNYQFVGKKNEIEASKQIEEELTLLQNDLNTKKEELSELQKSINE